MFNEGEEILSLRTFGGMTDDLLERVISMGKELAKRVFYLINHELLACSVCFIHFYNLNQFKKYSAAKLNDEQEAKQKAEYQKFLAERRRKRYMPRKEMTT